MSLTNGQKAPFVWFGGKSQAAPLIWQRLGDVGHYVEPFAGSLAVLLQRPHLANRTYVSETVNDSDGLLVNAWRAIQWHPDETAEACSWPVAEADLHARHAALVRWRAEQQLEHLMGDPLWCDVRMAGWWLYGCCAWIGGGWGSGRGPWIADETGRLVKQARVSTREPGIHRKLPDVSQGGRGVHHAQVRAPGIDRKRPDVSQGGRGVHRPQLRAPGISRRLPHVGNDGRGVHRPQLREPGEAYHECTMPQLREWFRALSARVRHVRIVNGDWRRVVTPGAIDSLSVRMGNDGKAGILLDPPYSHAVRANGIYHEETPDLAADVAAWALEHGARSNWRIVLCGFENEPFAASLRAAGWREEEWFRRGFLRGGYGNLGKNGTNQHRERIWSSPACLFDDLDPHVSSGDITGPMLWDLMNDDGIGDART